MAAYNLGYLLATLLIPAIGLTLLIVGIVQRRSSKSVTPGEPPKRSGTALIVTGTVVLVLGLAGAALRTVGSAGDGSSGPGVAVGDCVTADGYAEGTLKPVDCGEQTAVMEVASRGGPDARCPDGKARSETAYTSVVWDDATVCFTLNFIEGNCYSVNTTDTSDSPLRLRTCGGSGAQIKAVRRIDGTTDTRVCPPDTNPISVVKPARVVCLAPAGNR
ncbi:LppU/SCO3897 family protein [Mycolicibacterium celeriflavum]|uniref:LppU/SCO3897 family protein n=1 Tax=Mycolicibacterium celeriflavum TaxID=1249101 RepID=UPI003CF04612